MSHRFHRRPSSSRAGLVSLVALSASISPFVSPALGGDLLSAPRGSTTSWDTSGTGLPIQGITGVAADRGVMAFKSAVANLGLTQECVRVGESGSIRFAAEPGTAIVSPVVGEQQAGFGDAIALFGGDADFPPRLVVGAPLEDHAAGANAGAIYIFDRLEGLWVQRARIVAPDATANDRFGMSVGIDRADPTVIVVGAPDADGGGRAYRVNFTLQGAQSVGRLEPGVAIGAAARFGFAVAVTRGVAVVGAPDDLDLGGRVHIFRADTRAALVRIDGVGIEALGAALDARDGVLAVGAPYAPAIAPVASAGRVAIVGVEDAIASAAVDELGELRPPETDVPAFQFGASIALHPKGISVLSQNSPASIVRVRDYRLPRLAPVETAVPCLVQDISSISSFGASATVACMGEVLLVGGTLPGLNAASCRAFDMRVGGRDQDLDSVDDLLLVKPATGGLRIWTLDGGARDGNFVATEGAPPAPAIAFGSIWTCLGSADLWGNGRFATLWRHKTSMQLKALFASGPEFVCTESDVLVPPAFGVTAGVTGKVLGLADTNGDRTTDLLVLENGTTVVEHAMRGPEIVSRRELANITGHAFLGLGDFNGDGIADAILRKTSNNRLRLLAIGVLGAEIVDFVSEGPGPAIVFPSSLDVAATGDFTGDGADDMVIFNATARRVQIWSFEGVIRASRTDVGGTLAPGWTVRAALDADGDFDPDIALVRATTRDVAVWQMEGTTKVALTLRVLAPVGSNILNGVEQRR